MTRRFVEALASWYERLLRRVLKRPLLAAIALLVLVAVGGFLVRNQETGFLPSMDEGAFVMDYRTPVGTSLAETDGYCRKVEAVLGEVPEVRAFSRRTGAELGFFATEQNTGDFLVGLKPRGERKRTNQEVIDDVRDRLAHEVPQLEYGFMQVMQDTINDLAGNPSPVEVKVFGQEYRQIQDLAKVMGDRIEKVPGVVDVKSGVSFGSPEITYRFDAAALARAGLTVATASEQIRTALLGEEATRLRRGERLVPVRVRYPDAVRKDPTRLRDLPIADGSGSPIPVSLVAHIEERTSVNELARENQQPVVSVTGNTTGRDLGSVARDVRALLARLPRTSGVRTELAGQIEGQERAFKNLMLVLVLAVGLVFLLLVAQFRSYRLPVVIFLTLPFSQVGALAALLLTGTEVNISAMMGLIMLVGLVVKNGIILIEYAAQLRRQGAPSLEEALVRASRVRLRPILMTSLTAVMALLPLAFNIGTGSELQRPLAIAVIGGLSVSTLFTLLVVPVCHHLLGEPAHARPAPPGTPAA